MRRLGFVIVIAALAATLHSPADGQDKKKTEPKDQVKSLAPCPSGPIVCVDHRPVVFVANGVNGSTNASDSLIDLNSEMRLGLRVQPVPWTRHDAHFKDLMDHDAQLNAAARLAGAIGEIRKQSPHQPIFLMGHSAGARVVLAAAEMAPPRSIDRVIVLAPAVSWCYDLTGALKASRGGVDHFYSTEDSVLDNAVYHHGLADGTKGPAAGRIGFRLASTDKNDAELYRNVRQYRWTEDYCGSGGHCTWVIRHNMKKAIVPLFFAGTVMMEPPRRVEPPQKMPKN